MAKFYGVRNCDKAGVYNTWEETQKVTKGVSGVEFKSFKTEKEAREFVYGTTEKNSADNTQKPIDKSNAVYFYVDGSYKEYNVQDKVIKSAGYGVVAVKDGQELFRLCGKVPGNNEEVIATRNVLGEVYATITAIQSAIANNYKDVVIAYDYEGIRKWAKGEWKANKPLTKRYVEFFNTYTKNLNIEFLDITAHTGHKFNEIADGLAKLGTTFI